MSNEYTVTSPDDIVISGHAHRKSIESHYHRFVELVFLTDGTCDHYYLGHKKPLQAGDVFIIVPGEEHAYEIGSKVTIINCLFYWELLKDEWKTLQTIGGFYNFVVLEPFFRFEENTDQILHLSPTELTYVESLLSLIREEYQTREDGYTIVAKSYLITMLMFLGRVWEKTYRSHSLSYGKKRELVEDAIHHIDTNLSDRLTVDALASMLYLSPDYFRRVFRDVTGQSPIKYINKLRIEKAKELLAQSDLTVSKISEAVGVGDPQYFSKLFHEAEGMTPLQYRNGFPRLV